MKKVLLIIFMFMFTTCSYAYTKEDISSLKDDFIVCDEATKNIVNGLSVTYNRLLNERDISSISLDLIYNNIVKVKDILISNNICSIEDKDKIPSNIKEELRSLYNETNDIILNSDSLSNDTDEVNIVLDSSRNEIKVYEDDSLINVIGITNEFNYVGLNIYLIIFELVLLVIIIFLLVIRKDFVLMSIFYSLFFIFISVFIFRNNISFFIDNLSSFSYINSSLKEIKTSDNKIISYPSVGYKYASIYINDEKEDIYFGDSSSILKMGIGTDTNSKILGEDGMTILSGHNTGIFKYLDTLSIDDEISIETLYAKFKYKVVDSEVLNKYEKNKLKDYDLVMYTCIGDVLYSNDRLVIYLEKIDEKWI